MTVHYEVSNDIATMTLDNGPHNFLNVEMYQRMTELLEEIESDDAVKVTILTGSTGDSFCAGDDLKARPRPIDVKPHWPTRLFTAERTKPIIAAIHGWALGGGFQLAIALGDIRLATTDAKLGAPEIAYGMGGLGGAVRLVRHMPRAVAMQMMLTGDYLTAAQAHRLHFVNQVVEPDLLAGEALHMAGRIARHPLVAITTEVQAMNDCADLSPSDALAHASSLYKAQLVTHEEDNPYDAIVPKKPEPLDLGAGPGM